MDLIFINSSQETFTPTQSGAIATVLWEQCQAALRRGVEPLVISRNSPAAPYPWPRQRLVSYPLEPKSPTGIFLGKVDRRLTGWRYPGQRRYAGRLASAIAALELPRPVFVLNNDPEIAVFLRRRFPRSRIVHCFHNQHGCRPRFRERFGEAVDAITAVSDFTADWVASHYRVPRQRVTTLYNGVDLDHFFPAPGCASGLPVIGFVGRTGIEKGPDVLLDAAERLAQRTLNFSLQLLGSNHWDRFEMDDYQRRLEVSVRRLEERGISVRRPGHIARAMLPDELRKARIHVVPARWDEPFGLSTLEGMACGLATVSSRTGGTPEVVGDAAILFERESSAELAAVLERLLRDENERREWGSRARRRAEAFSWDRCWETLWQIVSSLDCSVGPRDPAAADPASPALVRSA